MINCSCYRKEFGKEVCYGTKEREECECGGDAVRCDFYPNKRVLKSIEEPIDIFTLLQQLQRKGYELTFGPGRLFAGTVWISLRDPKTFYSIEIQMHVDKNYFKDPSSVIFEQINAMIRDMDNYTGRG